MNVPLLSDKTQFVFMKGAVFTNHSTAMRKRGICVEPIPLVGSSGIRLPGSKSLSAMHTHDIVRGGRLVELNRLVADGHVFGSPHWNTERERYVQGGMHGLFELMIFSRKR